MPPLPVGTLAALAKKDGGCGWHREAELGRYNRRHSGQPVSFMDRVRDAPTLLARLVGEIFSARGATLLLALHFTLPALGSVLGVLLYVLSPIDVIPDWSVVGLLDDFVVTLLMLIFVSRLYRGVITAALGPEHRHDD